MRTMYDGIDSDAGIIPADAQLVAGYVDGDYAWTAADWARFPHAIHVPIAVKSTTDAGTVLDVERGNASPAESVDWVLMRRRAGTDPTVYCSLSVWPEVRAAFQARGVAEPHYWIASYDGNTAIPAGAIAHQYQNTPHWDVSSVLDHWPGVDPEPAPVTAPTPVHPQVQLGSSGEQVAALQALLTALGFDTRGVDGDYGPDTKGAVEAFQRAQHISDDGQAGKDTNAHVFTAMKSLRYGGVNLELGAGGTAVRTLQAGLWWRGFDPHGVDGDYGPDTRSAVEAFQRAVRIGDDGQAGPETWGWIFQGN